MSVKKLYKRGHTICVSPFDSVELCPYNAICFYCNDIYLLEGIMARLARAVAPGCPHHVTQRGNRRQPTFFDNNDYRLYLEFLEDSCHKTCVEIWQTGTHKLCVPVCPVTLVDILAQAGFVAKSTAYATAYAIE
jgi:hypothetical protein